MYARARACVYTVRVNWVVIGRGGYDKIGLAVESVTFLRFADDIAFFANSENEFIKNAGRNEEIYPKVSFNN